MIGSLYYTFSLLYLKNRYPLLLLRHLSLLEHPLRSRINPLRIWFLLYVVLKYQSFSFIFQLHDHGQAPTIAPIVVDSPRPIAALPKRPSTPKPFVGFLLCTLIQLLHVLLLKTSSSGGFAAFAGSASIFASPNKPQISTSSLSRPIWTTSKNELEISESSSIEAFKPAKDVGTSEVTLATSKYTR